MHFNTGVVSQKILMELISSVNDICILYRIYDYFKQIDQDDLESRQDLASIILTSRVPDSVSLSRALVVEDLSDYTWSAEDHFLEGWVYKDDTYGKIFVVKTRGRPWTGWRKYITHQRRLRTSVRAAWQYWLTHAGETRTNHPVSGQLGNISQTLDFALSPVPWLIRNHSRYARLC